MFYNYICSLILLASLPDPNGIVPAFKDSILQGNIPAAVDMISLDAIETVNSVLADDPGQITNILAYFGLQIEIQDMEEIDGRELLEVILSSPTVSSSILLFGVSPGEPVQIEDRIFVPVGYGLFGQRDTVHLEIVSENEEWRINDFFEIIP